MTIDQATVTGTALRPLDLPTKFIMLTAGLLPALALIGVTAVLPQIEAALAHDAQDRMLIKQLVSGVAFAMMIGAPITGFLVDRFGTKLILLINCLMYALAGTAGLYLQSLSTLLASRLLVGLAAGGIITIGMTLINTRLEGVERAKWMGALTSVAIASTLILHPLIGFLGDFGWRQPFVLYALGVLLAAATLFIQDSRPTRPAPDSSKPAAKLMSWFPFGYAILGFAIGLTAYIPLVYLPFVMRKVGVTSPSEISWVLTANALIGSATAILFGRARQHLSSAGAFVFSFTFAGAGMAIIAMAPTATIMIAGVLVIGLGLGWLTPNLMTAGTRHVQANQQGRAVGVLRAFHSMAAPIGVVLLEPITRAHGPEGALWFIAALSLVFVCVFAFRLVSQRGVVDVADKMPVTLRH
jgi:MFS family permease